VALGVIGLFIQAHLSLKCRLRPTPAPKAGFILCGLVLPCQFPVFRSLTLPPAPYFYRFALCALLHARIAPINVGTGKIKSRGLIELKTRIHRPDLHDWPASRLTGPAHSEKISLPCPLADECVVTAIDDDLKIVADAGASDAKKLDALKFLGHWVGDIHQPLHVSFQDDRGGNRIGEAGPCERNLHIVWDKCLVEIKLGTDIRSIATDLSGGVTPANRNRWNSTGPKTWANESFELTTSDAVEYCIKKDSGCWYAADNKTLDANEARRVAVVNDAYMERQLPTVKKRLTQAGIRLGHSLNQALSGLTDGNLMQTFSITNLVARLRKTGAIGFLTKLALKNQIDDLIGEFREFHAGVGNTELSVLKDRFNLLLMKVVTLLQDDDPILFQDIVSTREILWTNFADPEKFGRL